MNQNGDYVSLEVNTNLNQIVAYFPKGTDSTNKLQVKITISDQSGGQSELSGSIVTVMPITTPHQIFIKLKEV